MKRILQTELLEEIRDDINAELEARQNAKEDEQTGAQLANDAIALLRRVCSDANVSHLSPDTFDDLMRWQQHH